MIKSILLRLQNMLLITFMNAAQLGMVGGCVAVAVVDVVVVVLAMGSHGPAGRLASTLVSQAVGSQFDATQRQKERK